MLPTAPQRAATLRLTIGHEPAHVFQASGETRFHGERCFHTLTPVPIPQPQTHREAAIPTHAETEEPLLEIVAPVLAGPVGRPGSPWWLRFVLIGPIKRQRRGGLRESGRRHGIDLQRFQGEGATHLVEIGSKQGIEDMPSTVIMERGPG